MRATIGFLDVAEGWLGQWPSQRDNHYYSTNVPTARLKSMFNFFPNQSVSMRLGQTPLTATIIFTREQLVSYNAIVFDNVNDYSSPSVVPKVMWIDNAIYWIESVRPVVRGADSATNGDRFAFSLRMDVWTTYRDRLKLRRNPILVRRRHYDRWVLENNQWVANTAVGYSDAPKFLNSLPLSFDNAVELPLQFKLPVGVTTTTYPKGVFDIMYLLPNHNIRKRYQYSDSPLQPLAIIVPLANFESQPFDLPGDRTRQGTTWTRKTDAGGATPPDLTKIMGNELNRPYPSANWDRLIDEAATRSQQSIDNYTASHSTASYRAFTNAERLAAVITDNRGNRFNYIGTRRVRGYDVAGYARQESTYDYTNSVWTWWVTAVFTADWKVTDTPPVGPERWDYYPNLQRDVDGLDEANQWQRLMGGRFFLPLGYVEHIANGGDPGEAALTTAPSYKDNDNPSKTYSAPVIVRTRLRRTLSVGGSDFWHKPYGEFKKFADPSAGEFIHHFASAPKLFYGQESVVTLVSADIFRNRTGEFRAEYHLNNSQTEVKLFPYEDAPLTTAISATISVSQPTATDSFTATANQSVNTYNLNQKLQTESLATGITSQALGFLFNGLPRLIKDPAQGVKESFDTAVAIKSSFDYYRRLEATTADAKTAPQQVGQISTGMSKHLSYWFDRKDPLFSNLTIWVEQLSAQSLAVVLDSAFRFGYSNNRPEVLASLADLNTRTKFNYWDIDGFSDCLDNKYPNWLTDEFDRVFSAGATMLHEVGTWSDLTATENWERAIVWQ